MILILALVSLTGLNVSVTAVNSAVSRHKEFLNKFDISSRLELGGQSHFIIGMELNGKGHLVLYGKRYEWAFDWKQCNPSIQRMVCLTRLNAKNTI